MISLAKSTLRSGSQVERRRLRPLGLVFMENPQKNRMRTGGSPMT